MSELFLSTPSHYRPVPAGLICTICSKMEVWKQNQAIYTDSLLTSKLVEFLGEHGTGCESLE